MAPKKKKLTPEERKKLLAEKKLMKKLAADEARRKVKRDHLSRELKYGELNRKLLEKGWRDMLLNIKLPEMQADIEIAINSFDEVLDLKDCQIGLLKDELDEAEEQYQINFRSHCESMEQVLGIFHDILDELKNNYDVQLKEVLKAAFLKNTGMIEQQTFDEEYINVILYRLDLEGTNIERVIKGNYISKHEGDTKQNFDALQLLRSNEERHFEKLWNEYAKILNDYTNEMEDKKEEYDKLHKLDNALRCEIKTQTTQIYLSQEFIRRLKLVEENEHTATYDKINNLSNQKENFGQTLQVLKDKFSKDVKNDDQQMLLLVQESKNVEKYLQGMVHLCEKILKWKLMCEKYETKEDVIKVSDEYQPDEFMDIKKYSENIAQIEVQRLKLIKQKEYLIEENNLLKEQLRKYCEDANCYCRSFNIKRLNEKYLQIH